MANPATGNHGRRPARVIAGSGRGGTTWILDALAEANELRPVFEPLHPDGVTKAAGIAHACEYNGSVPDGAEAFFEAVFDGDLHTLWSDYRVRRDRLAPHWSTLVSVEKAKRFYRRWRKLLRNRASFRPALKRQQCLVKLIRGNLMLGWLHRVFDARIVLVIRHPGAVIESQMRLGGSDWNPNRMLGAYVHQSAFQQQYGERCANLLEGTLTPAETHAAVWCIENQLPLENAGRGSFLVVFYENLLDSPHAEWRRMADWLGLAETPSQAKLATPSQQTSLASLGQRLDQPRAPGWTARLAPDAASQIQKILNGFGVDAYNMEDPMPTQRVAPAANG